MTVVVVSPVALAQINTKLAEGPAVHPDPIEVNTGDGCRVVIRWRELPHRLAAVIALVGGVLWLIVSPTAPDASAHARELLRTSQVAESPGPVAPAPVRPLRPRRSAEVSSTPAENRRRDHPGAMGLAPA